MKPTTSILLAGAISICGIFMANHLSRAPIAHAQTGCDASTFTGAYGYTESGYAYDIQGNIYILAATGRMVADGNGVLTGSETLSFDGNIVRRQFTGTYTMTEECSGSITVQFASTGASAPIHGDIVAVNNARQINFVQTDPNFVFSGVLTRQSQ
jgi:hypothetical protein